MQSASKFILTTEAHKLQMINKVGLYFCVADFAEERNSYEFKALVCIAAQKPQKNNPSNGKFIISTSLHIERIFQQTTYVLVWFTYRPNLY